jgi:hypothetical protein
VKPWGWRIVGKKTRRAHYFERVDDGSGSPAYASNSSLCGQERVGRTLEHWTAHPHAGVVPLCPTCCKRLTGEP